MMGCYAYRECRSAVNAPGCRWVEEPLGEHLLGVARKCRGHPLLREVAAKAGRFYGEELEYVEDLIVLACMLHDVGKALEEFQGGCPKGCTHFSGHDVAGYKIAATALVRALGKGAVDHNRVEVYALLVPILVHHYFQRSPDTLKRDASRIATVELHSLCIPALKEAIEGARGLVRTDRAKRILDAALEVVSGGRFAAEPTDLPRLVSYLQSFKVDFCKAFAEAVVAIVNECDGEVAGAARSG